MRKTEETTIRGRTFKVTQLPGMRGVRLFYRLAGVIVPALVKLGKGLAVLEDFSTFANMEAAQALKTMLPGVGDAVQSLLGSLPEDELDRLIREVLENAQVRPLDGGKLQPLMPIFDEEMAGETSAVFQLVGFALTVNYGNFMPGLVAKARSLMATQASQSKESAT